MSLLSDIEILQRLVSVDEDCIFVSPLVDPCRQIGPSSLDVHLGTDLHLTVSHAGHCIDVGAQPSEVESQVKDYFEERSIEPSGSFILHPGEFALGETLEYIALPRDIAGRIEGRSSYARLGLQIHATAGFIDPGFQGPLTLELTNCGRLPLVLRPGVRLAQLCFFVMNPVQVGYSERNRSKYVGHLRGSRSLVHQDHEVHVERDV